MDVEQIVRWHFSGEKAEAFWILTVGAVSLLGAIVLWFVARDHFARGLALALLIMAGLGLGMGGTVYFRSDEQSQRLIEQQRTNPAQLHASWKSPSEAAPSPKKASVAAERPSSFIPIA